MLFASAASAQVITGMAVQMTCPDSPVAPGASFACTFTVQNLDPANTVTGLVVTTTPQGGSPTAIPCSVGGTPVTILQPSGTPGGTCTGGAQATAPACQPANSVFTVEIDASGTDSGTNSPVFSSGSGAVRIPACTPTANSTPTATPTSVLITTPTNTPTTTRTNTPTTTPTGVAKATPTSTPAVTGTPTSLRPKPREIPFRPTISAAGGAAGSFPPLVLLAAVLTGARALSRH